MGVDGRRGGRWFVFLVPGYRGVGVKRPPAGGLVEMVGGLNTIGSGCDGRGRQGTEEIA